MENYIETSRENYLFNVYNYYTEINNNNYNILNSNPERTNELIKTKKINFNNITYGNKVVISGPAICALDLKYKEELRSVIFDNVCMLYNDSTYINVSNELKINNNIVIINNLNFNELIRFIKSDNFTLTDTNIELLVNRLKDLFLINNLKNIKDLDENYLIKEDYCIAIYMVVDTLLYRSHNRSEYRLNQIGVNKILELSDINTVNKEIKEIDNKRKEFTNILKKVRDK